MGQENTSVGKNRGLYKSKVHLWESDVFLLFSVSQSSVSFLKCNILFVYNRKVSRVSK